MAGSYNHCINDEGNLLGPFALLARMLETDGDVFEAIEEMYGMIWWLAHMGHDAVMTPEDLVEMARKNYALGLELAKANKNKRKHGS